MSGALGLARIGQAAALATHEDVAAGVQLRHPPSAALTISGILSAQEPRTSAAEMAPRPRERHAPIYGFPLFLFRSTPRKQQNHGVAPWCELDGPGRLAAASPRPGECSELASACAATRAQDAAVQIGSIRPALPQRACRGPQHLQLSTPSRLAINAADLSNRSGERMAKSSRGRVIAYLR